VVTATGAGSTSIVAHAPSSSDASTQVTVPMVFSPPSITVAVGSSAPIGLGPLSLSCRGSAPVYTVGNSAVAQVSSQGAVTALGIGTTNVLVTAGSCTGTVAVTTTAAPDLTVPAGAISVKLHRFQGSAGSVAFSTGLPLPPGKLRATDLNKVRFFLAGVEQPIFVKALGGTHTDGSLRSVLLQGVVAGPAAGQDIPGSVSVNSTRVAATLTETAPLATLDAAVLASSPDYLVSTLAGGPMLTQAQLASQPQFIRDQDADFERIAPALYAQFPTAYSRGIANYEHVLSTYQHYLETADPKWYDMAWHMGDVYRAYGEANSAPEWHITTEGLALHYWFTGDERSRAVVGKMTQWLVGTMTYIYPFDNADGKYRLKARAITSAVDCLMIACNPGVDGYAPPFNTQYDVRAFLAAAATKLFATQAASGLLPGSEYGGGQKNYMVGMMLSAFTRQYDEVTPNATILAGVKKSLDYMWSTEWQVSGQGFRYCSTNFSDCNTGTEIGVNDLILPAYAWYYAKTHDATYLAMADQIIAGNRQRRPDWPGFPVQFDQAFYRIVNYYARRQ
jgi:hypothetical protein